MTGKALPNGFYGPGKGPIWKLQDGCLNDIPRCLMSGREHEDCNHEDDVSVYCDCRLTCQLNESNSVLFILVHAYSCKTFIQ